MLNQLLKVSRDLEDLKSKMLRVQDDRGLMIRYELEHRLMSDALNFVLQQVHETESMMIKIQKYVK